MKYLILTAFIIASIFSGYTYFNQSNGVGGGLGTIEQLGLWFFDGVNITQNTSRTPIKLTGYESSGDCLVTNASGVVSTSTCGGDGSSKWTDGGSVIYPAGGESVAVSSISATGTATSTFTRLSVSTALNLFGIIGTALSDFCVAITGGSGLCDGSDDGGGGGGSISTSTTPVAGQLAFWTSPSALSSVATGTLTESVNGLQFDNTRGVIGGSAVLSLTSGFQIPSSTDFINWNTAYASTTALTNTFIRGLFSNTVTGLTYNSGTGVTSLNAGFAIPSTTDYTGWNLASSSRHSAVTLSGALDYITLVGQDIVRGAIDLATDITGTLLVGNGGTGLTSTSTFLFENEIDTETELETFLTDVTNVFTNNDGTLADDNLTNNSIEDLSDVDVMTENTGDLLIWNGSAWTDTATSALGYSWNNLINIPAGFADGVDDTGGGGGGGLATTSPWTNGNLAYVTGLGTVGSVATGTLTTTATGLSLSNNPAIIGSNAVLSLDAGRVIPLSASTTEWTNFYNTPSTRITAGANCSWAGNTFNCEGGSGGGGGGALSTTTDVIGAPATPELVSYVTGDVMFGGSASTSAEFQFDDDGGQFILSSTSNSNATATIESNNNAQAVRIGDDSGVGLEWIFNTASTIITKVYGAITAWIIDIAKVAVTGKLYVATTTYNGATTTDALVIDGYTNSGEWIQEFCTSPTGETTAITADTLRACGRYAYSEDGAGQLDFVVPTTGTSTYFNLQPGATGANNAAGDGMLINWASGLDFGDIQRHQPAMEFPIRQDVVLNATATTIFAGLTSAVGVNADAAAEPAQGFYVVATSTTPNYLLACNPSTGATTYVDTGIASSTTATASANPFTHFRLEVSGTANTAVTAILKARVTSDRNMLDKASCTIDVSASTQAVAPTVAIGKSGAGTGSDLHLMFLKFWYKQPVFY